MLQTAWQASYSLQAHIFQPRSRLTVFPFFPSCSLKSTLLTTAGAILQNANRSLPSSHPPMASICTWNEVWTPTEPPDFKGSRPPKGASCHWTCLVSCHVRTSAAFSFWKAPLPSCLPIFLWLPPVTDISVQVLPATSPVRPSLITQWKFILYPPWCYLHTVLFVFLDSIHLSLELPSLRIWLFDVCLDRSTLWKASFLRAWKSCLLV